VTSYVLSTLHEKQPDARHQRRARTFEDERPADCTSAACRCWAAPLGVSIITVDYLAMGILNIASSMGVLCLISVNLRIKPPSSFDRRMVNGSLTPPTAR
jgi:hypothetical protein